MKRKVISGNNLAIYPHISEVVSFWFLWEHLTQEWERTLLILFYGLLLISIIYSWFTTEPVDIFKEDKNG